MEVLSRIATQVRQDFRKILLVVIALGLVLLIACMIQYWSLTNIRGRLMENPELPPPYISAIAPFPGTEYPTDLYSHPYWHEVRGESGVCVRADAHVIVSEATDYERAFHTVPYGSMNLFLNGRPIDQIADIWPDNTKHISKIIGGFPSTIANPQNLEELYFPDHVPINFCWTVSLPPDTYLAEVAIRAEKSKTLHYQWAFQVVAP